MFRDRLKQARKASGYTQESLAQAIGVKKSTVCGYEAGNSEPDMDKIIKIMSVLNVDANYLYQDEMKSAPEPSFSVAALELARLYDTLDERGRNLIDSMARLEAEYTSEAKRPKGLMPIGAVPMKMVPHIGTLDCTGSIETRHAARQELQELEAESTQLNPIPEHE